ncbi:MAG: pseudouridine synthase [Nitrospinae bacterium RIFCSPLOWO2_12_39_16]|nr:MAG: pseudouridine synthase [Nitrospinae bacterium RIFCSPLOWO2_12_39_16]HLA48445.1 pseudouridine synthase [Nitrospinota bacterium]
MKESKKDENLIRLQKIISQAGISSRREAERLIIEGRVLVNGNVVRELGAKADPRTDDIRVDGKKIKKEEQKIYILLNKPKGCITTVKDDRGRPTVIDLLRGVKKNVYPVGRLDFNTEGILLLTNDGDFAQHLAHPRHKIPKTYSVKISGVPTEKELRKLSDGVVVFKRKTAPAQVRFDRTTGNNSWLTITLHEGKKRQIRRMCEIIGHPVIKLKRIKYGFLELGNLKPGEYRSLSSQEAKRLMETTGR